MTDATPERLRVALISHELRETPSAPGALAAVELSTRLRAAGHQVTLITSHRGRFRKEVGADGVVTICVRRFPETPLRVRGFATPLSGVPGVVAGLRAARIDVAHAFSPVDVGAALIWRRLRGGAVVFTATEPPTRETLADNRLSFDLTTRAFRDPDAITAATRDARDGIVRWLARDVRVMAPSDASGYAALYESCL